MSVVKFTPERERTRTKREFDLPQNWEALAESAPRAWERFSRFGALDELLNVFDDALAQAQAAETRRLELLAREYGPQAQAAPRVFIQRRPGDEPRPFKDLHQAMTFVIVEPVFGIGAVNLEVAEDTNDTIKARARRAFGGRPIPLASDGTPAAGFLPYDDMPAKQTHTHAGRCRGIERVNLYVDTLRCIGAANLSRLALQELVLVDIGVPMKHVPAVNGAVDCPCGAKAHKVPPGEPIKGSGGEKFIPPTAAEQCKTWIFWQRLRPANLATEQRTKERVGMDLSKARAMLSTALIEGELLEGPKTSTRRVTPREEAPEQRRAEIAEFCANWES